MKLLNGEMEVGIRALFLLDEAFPNRLDISRLVLLDYWMLHSADVNGPASLHVALPMRSGELGIKRTHIERGLQMIVRAGLAEIGSDEKGIYFVASDRAMGFTQLLESSYSQSLRTRANWVIQNVSWSGTTDVRTQLNEILGSWSGELDRQLPRSLEGDTL